MANVLSVEKQKLCLKMLAEGRSVKEIACDLNLSVKTVEAHLANVFTKLGIRSRQDLLRALPRSDNELVLA